MTFRTNPDDCRLEINKWVEQQTRDRIKDLLPGGSITDMTSLVLTNAIYFKGQWDVKFKEENTKQGTFITLSRKEVPVDMMNIQEKFNLYQGDGVQLIELPYAGKEFSIDRKSVV